jgi:hypothetical protein
VVVEALIAEPALPRHDPRDTEPHPPDPQPVELRREPRGDLAPGPSERVDTVPAPARQALPTPRLRLLGIGLMLGGSSDQDTLIGGRVGASVPVPQGALRTIGSLLYTRFNDNSDDPNSLTQLFALGVSVDYVWMPVPYLAFGGGLGLGMDRLVRNMDRETDSSSWWTLRASPVIVRGFEGRVEAGFHLQYVRTSDRGVVLGLVAIDLFPL